MENQLRQIREKALESLAAIEDSQALEQLRVQILGKKGELTGILRGMGKLSAEERPRMGQLVNSVRSEIETALEEKLCEIREIEKARRLADGGHRHHLPRGGAARGFPLR